VSEVHEGGCLCGSVRWRAVAAPKNVNHCHCEMCRRGSGAAVVSWAAFAAKDFTFTRGAPAWRQSSSIARRSFCSTCGSALNWQSLEHSDGIDVTVGTADRPEALAPREHL
jgi:hypothetical protein